MMLFLVQLTARFSEVQPTLEICKLGCKLTSTFVVWIDQIQCALMYRITVIHGHGTTLATLVVGFLRLQS